MKLDAKTIRYLTGDEVRVLTAVEMGSRNHEVVPCTLIASIAGLRHSGAYRVMEELARKKLIGREPNHHCAPFFFMISSSPPLLTRLPAQTRDFV